MIKLIEQFVEIKQEIRRAFEKANGQGDFLICFHDHYSEPHFSVWHLGDMDSGIMAKLENGKLEIVESNVDKRFEAELFKHLELELSTTRPDKEQAA